MIAAPTLSNGVRALAGAIAATTGAHRGPVRINAELARLAIRRHRVGPLIHAASECGALEASDDLKIRLSEHAKANARRAALGRLVQLRAVRALAEAGIASLVFKGLPLADLLYRDPAWRHFGDLDLLVRPGDFRSASACLAAHGMTAGGGELPAHGPLAALSTRLLRDIHLQDNATGLRVELHQRLLFVTPGGARASWQESFTPRVPAGKNEVASPAQRADMAFYLLLHGALSGWWRLKWLADTFLLIPQLTPAEAQTLATTAEACGTALSVKASLILLRAVFACQLPAALEAWVAEPTGAAGVARRLAYYRGLLSEPREAAPSPAHSRIEGLKSLLFVIESMPQRAQILLRGPLASALRFAARRAQWATPAEH